MSSHPPYNSLTNTVSDPLDTTAANESTAQPNTSPEQDPPPHAEWIESALSIIQAGKEAELQHRQTVAEMKSMAEMMDMQAPFPSTIMAVSALVRDHPGDMTGKAYVEGALWGVIEELSV